MQIYHLLDTGEVAPAITPVIYGRCAASVLEDGKVICDNHLFALDTDSPPDPGERLMIWCAYEYFCCRVSEYETIYRH
jgi:hypothetical protein